MTGRAAVRTPPTRRRLGRDERRSATITAAATVFARSGFAATSMADVTAAAGVSHLIVYRHFESKAALYEAVLGRSLDQLRVVMDAESAVGRYGPTAAALLVAARSDPDAFTVLWRHASREPEFSGWTDRARRLLVTRARAALTEQVGADHRGWAAKATVSYVVEAVLGWVEDGDPRADARFLAATDAALRAGIRTWARTDVRPA